MIFGKKRSNLSDEELLAKYRQDLRKKWVGELFNRHAHLVFGVCLKYLRNEPEAKDATLELFEKLLIELKEKEVTNFPGWLYTVSKNHCLMILRKQKTHTKHTTQLNGTEQTEADEIEDKRLNEVKFEQLETALHELKEEQEVCVRMFYLEQRCYQEIADHTGFPLKKVKSYIQNGKRNLKLKLIQHDEFKY